MFAATIAILTGNKGGQNTPRRKLITLDAILAVLFAVKLRESLDAATSGDKSDAALTWGM
ncbi:hypothetical protein SAMN04515617_1392 [Collimonas sp. OK242]|jgi:hypothetical protein|uniref:hypothetical protein n=1 Tax=Collimonas sp. OK242 TaxID=1798195 RepID=UPI00089C9671|nr:hypothetical protein [Collimonas sp. OK242]SDY97535.1 hypothetical protein SAMN04515617_1392 [Collimonas sp. OK242]